MKKTDNLRKNSLSFIFPAYNEEANIEKAIDEARQFAKKRTKEYEIIVVNDGSHDKTGLVVEELARKDKHLRLINHRKNQGYGRTVWDGLKVAKKELVFFTDSDLQFKISELDKFLRQINLYDVIIGYRADRKDPLLRKVNAWCWKWLIYLTLGIKVEDVDCAFKLFRKKVIEKIKIDSKGATFSAELLYRVFRGGWRILELPVKHYPRQIGSPTGAKLSVITRAFVELWRFYWHEPPLAKKGNFLLSILAIAALFCSRFFILSNSRDFFDSSQYVWRSQIGSLIGALTSGHPPFHPLYNFFSFIFAKYFAISNGVLAASLPSALFGSLSVITIYFLVKELFSRKMAWFVSVAYTLVPFVWISQITVLVDPVEHFFYFLSLYIWVLAARSHRIKSIIWAFLAGISFGLAGFAHTQVALWILGFLAVSMLASTRLNWFFWRKFFLLICFFILGGLPFIFFYVKLLIIARESRADLISIYGPTYKEALKYLIAGNAGDRQTFSPSSFRAYLTAVSSFSVLVLALISLIYNFLKKKRIIIALLIWILPGAALGSTYIYENLYGRVLIPALLSLLILVGLLIFSISSKYKTVLLIVLIGQLGLVSVPVALNYHKLPAANEVLASMQKDSDQEGVFISTNVTKTWANYRGDFVNFGDVGVGAQIVLDKIKNALSQSKPVYITSSALRFPQRRYDGIYFDIRSTENFPANRQKSLLDEMLRSYSLVLSQVASFNFKEAVYKISQDDEPSYFNDVEKNLQNNDLVFGRIIDSNNPVPNISTDVFSPLICNRVRDNITRADIFLCLKRILSGDLEAQNWSFSDRNGWFFVPAQIEGARLVLGLNPSVVRPNNPSQFFIKDKKIEVQGEYLDEYSDINELKKKIETIEGPFYVLASKKNTHEIFKLYSFDFELETTSKIEAENLDGEVGEISSDRKASGGKVRSTSLISIPGYLISGPYLDLDQGHYEVIYSVRAKRKSANTVLFDVASESGKNIHFKKEISANELAQKEFQQVKLDFEIGQKTNGFEFRVKVPKMSDLEIDYIELKKI